MAIEYKEDLIMEQAREEAEMAALGKTTGNQDAKRVVKVSKKQLDADFENLDLRDYDDPKPDK